MVGPIFGAFLADMGDRELEELARELRNANRVYLALPWRGGPPFERCLDAKGPTWAVIEPREHPAFLSFEGLEVPIGTLSRQRLLRRRVLGWGRERAVVYVEDDDAATERIVGAFMLAAGLFDLLGRVARNRHRRCAPGAWGSERRCARHGGLPIDPATGRCADGPER